MTKNSKALVTCECGSTVQERGYKQHLERKKHKKYVEQHPAGHPETDYSVRKSTKFTLKLPSELPDLNTTLRYSSNEFRTTPRVLAIQALRHSTDPYTQEKLIFDKGKLTKGYDIDHIHEIQVMVYAINCTSGISLRAIEHLRREINDVSNLAITKSNVNRSKGQAVKYFLSHLDTYNEFSLLFALIQTSTSTTRQIAPYSGYIIDMISDTSDSMSNHIREIRRNDGYVTGSNEYASVADKFDSVIKKMNLDWQSGITLRSGTTYRPPSRKYHG